MRRVAWLVMVFSLLAVPAFAGQVYKWVDANGVVHFGDVPPHGGNAKSEVMPEAPPPVARPPQDRPADPAVPAAEGESAATGKDADVVVTDKQIEPLGPATQAIRGKVKNRGGTDAHGVYIALVVTEPTQGDECLREEIDVQPSTLAPGAEGSFDAEYDSPCFHGTTNAELRTEWR